MRVALRSVAHARSGDKGNVSNIALVVYDAAFFEHVLAQVTGERVVEHFAGRIGGPVEVFPVERLGVINYVARNALGGGVSRNLNLDQYGKSYSAALLGLEIEVPDRLANLLRAL